MVVREHLLGAVYGEGGVVADNPRVLVARDPVDRSLADNCDNVVDVQPAEVSDPEAAPVGEPAVEPTAGSDRKSVV